MVNYATDPLSEIVAAIVDDGVVDADEVTQLKARLYEDGVIDQEEADALFTINDAVSGNNNDPSWQDLFVEALGDYVLKDDVSPGVVDADEGQYLFDQICSDGQVDNVERALLARIKAEATEIQHPGLKAQIAINCS